MLINASNVLKHASNIQIHASNLLKFTILHFAELVNVYFVWEKKHDDPPLNLTFSGAWDISRLYQKCKN